MSLWPRWLPQVMEQLEEQWRSDEATIYPSLAPAATPAHLAEIEEQLGFSIPPEVAFWWQWHDGLLPGTSPRGGEFGAPRLGPSGMGFLAAADAVAERKAMLEIMGPMPDLESSYYWVEGWDRHWLPVFSGLSSVYFVDVRDVNALSGTVPVRVWEHTPTDPFSPVVGSFTALVATWADLMRRGVVRWFAEGENYVYGEGESVGTDEHLYRMQRILL